jgi:hypothetical protein
MTNLISIVFFHLIYATMEASGYKDPMNIIINCVLVTYKLNFFKITLKISFKSANAAKKSNFIISNLKRAFFKMK